MYVRTGAEEVFDALMLNSPTLSGLQDAVSNAAGKAIHLAGTLYSLIIDSSSLFWFHPSGFRKVWHAQRDHREDLQEMQERVSRFSPEGNQLHSRGICPRERTRLTNLRLSLLAASLAALQGNAGRQTGWVGLWNALIAAP